MVKFRRVFGSDSDIIKNAETTSGLVVGMMSRRPDDCDSGLAFSIQNLVDDLKHRASGDASTVPRIRVEKYGI